MSEHEALDFLDELIAIEWEDIDLQDRLSKFYNYFDNLLDDVERYQRIEDIVRNV